MMSEIHPKKLMLLVMVLVTLLPRCSPAVESGYLSPVTVELLDTPITVISDNLETIQSFMFQSTEARTLWGHKTAFASPDSEWGAWLTMFRVVPSYDTDQFMENPNRIPVDAEVHYYYLIRNAWKKPHSLRLIFLLDFQQLPVIYLGETYEFLDFHELLSQESVAIEFALPSLSNGFHQLSIILMTDPASTSSDVTYRIMQMKSFWEDRFDLWVGTKSLPEDVPRFEMPELGQAASNRMGGFEVLVSADSQIPQPLKNLALKQGEKHYLYLHFYNTKPEPDASYDGPIPLLIAISWNDVLKQVLNYELSADAPDGITLKLSVDTPIEGGSYQLNVIVFEFPGLSQFISPEQRTAYPRGHFSRRILVDVKPK